MEEKKQNVFIKIFVALSYVAMVTVNALANILPINGIDTGQISDNLPNLFTPQGYTFSIWGLIYLLLLGFVLYHIGLFGKSNSKDHVAFKDKIGIYFIISSLANMAWIFAWHYQIFFLTLLIMLVLLFTLITIRLSIAQYAPLNTYDKLFIRAPFSIYFGWITVATIANVTAFLVSIGWNAFGIEHSYWTIFILIIGAIIGITTMIRFKDMNYGLVFIWAYSGILMKHLAPGPIGFAKLYPGIINILMLCIVAFILTEVFLLFYRMKQRGV